MYVVTVCRPPVSRSVHDVVWPIKKASLLFVSTGVVLLWDAALFGAVDVWAGDAAPVSAGLGLDGSSLLFLEWLVVRKEVQ